MVLAVKSNNTRKEVGGGKYQQRKNDNVKKEARVYTYRNNNVHMRTHASSSMTILIDSMS